MNRPAGVLNAETRHFLPLQDAPTLRLCFLRMRYWLMRVPRRWGRQPFEVAFQIGVIDLDEVAALKRIGASLDLRSERVEIDAAIRRRHRDLRDHQCVGTSLLTAAAGASSQVVTRKGRIALACPLEYLKRLLEIATSRAFGELLLGATPTPSSHTKPFSSRDLPGST
jgi:hypothetical protein